MQGGLHDSSGATLSVSHVELCLRLVVGWGWGGMITNSVRVYHDS